MQKEYGLSIIGPSKSNMENVYICTNYYEYEIDRFQNVQKSPMDQQLFNDSNESQEDFQLRSPVDSLRMQDDFDLGVAGKNSEYEKSDSSSEDEVVVSHEQNHIKKILNDVFSILKISMIVDICKLSLFNRRKSTYDSLLFSDVIQIFCIVKPIAHVNFYKLCVTVF